MTRRHTKITDLNTAIAEILEEYGNDVTSATKAAVIEVANTAKKEVKSGAPVRTGTYQKSWAVKEDATSRLRTEAIVYSRNRYQIAHLLEKGHALRGGGRVAAIPHIAPAEQTAIKNMEEAIKKIAQG